MTEKKEVKAVYPPIKALTETAQNVRNVLVQNGRTDTLVYGLLMSLNDEVERGSTRQTLRKELQEAISVAHEQFSHLFFDEQPKKGGE